MCPASYCTALTASALTSPGASWEENNGSCNGKSACGSTSSPSNGGASTASGQTTATPSVSPSDSGSPQAALSSESKLGEKGKGRNRQGTSNTSLEMMMCAEGKMSVSNLLFDAPG